MSKVNSKFEQGQDVYYWLNMLFESGKKVKGRKTADELFDLYCVSYVFNHWTVDSFAELLMDFRLIEHRYAVAQIKTRVDMLPNEPTFLTNWMLKEKDVSTVFDIQAILNGKKKYINRSLSSAVESSVIDFATHWCADPQLFTPGVFNTESEMHCSVTVAYDAYTAFCGLFLRKPLGKKFFMQGMEKLGFEKRKGYARGISGLLHFRHLYVPGCNPNIDDPRIELTEATQMCRPYKENGKLITTPLWNWYHYICKRYDYEGGILIKPEMFETPPVIPDAPEWLINKIDSENTLEAALTIQKSKRAEIKRKFGLGDSEEQLEEQEEFEQEQEFEEEEFEEELEEEVEFNGDKEIMEEASNRLKALKELPLEQAYEQLIGLKTTPLVIIRSMIDSVFGDIDEKLYCETLIKLGR